MEEYYILIQAGIVLLVFLMGTFTAKRFNFLHGAIALIAIITFVSGVSALLCQYAFPENALIKPEDMYNANLTAAVNLKLNYLKDCEGIVMVTRYMIYFTLPLQIVSAYIVNSVQAFNLPESINQYFWIIYFAPTVIWLVSRILSGIFRR